MNDAGSELSQRLEQLRTRMRRAFETRAQLAPGSAPPRLIAVSKRHPFPRIQEAHALGLRDFGENYAQEFRDKASLAATAELPLPGLRWHFIGSLQRNKIKYVLGRALIHTVDSPTLVERLGQRAATAGLRQSILLEVNAGEAQKAGVRPAELPALLDAVGAQPSLHCEGLMTMAPLGGPELARAAFAKLAELRETHRGNTPDNVELRELSMGMSSDFELAIAHGATMVRVGSALFGPRPN